MALMWRSLALAGIALMALMAPVAGFQEERGPMAIVLHVNIINQTSSLNGNSSEQHISMAGEVRVDYVIFAVRVLLTASTDLAWAADVVPREMTFNSSGVQYFESDVSIPGGTYNRTATLTVKGNSTVSGVPTDTSSDTASIVVNGPGEGTGPVIPVVPPPKGTGAAVSMPNLPAVTAAISVAMVATTAAIFWIWKERRLRRGIASKKKRQDD